MPRQRTRGKRKVRNDGRRRAFVRRRRRSTDELLGRLVASVFAADGPELFQLPDGQTDSHPRRRPDCGVV